MSQQPAEASTIYRQFEDAIQKNKAAMLTDLKEVNLNHPLVKNSLDSAPSVINFVQQYLQRGKIDTPFNNAEYRLELQHKILRLSTFMTRSCIICGLTNGESVWVQCDVSKRWTHCICIGKDAEELKDDTIHYLPWKFPKN